MMSLSSLILKAIRPCPTRAESRTPFEKTTILRRIKMKLTPPKVITWWIAVILGVLALLGYLKTIAALTQYDFWLALAGLALLAIACLVKNL
jgi:hypothetical protein